MAEQKTATFRTAKRTSGEASGTFTDEEKAAAKERVKEMRRSPRASKADGERDVLEKISEMDGTDRVMAERIHAIVTASAHDLAPRTWYGMPAYANEDGKVVCFFKNASKFGVRYATLGFADTANLDDGNVWPTEYAVRALGPDDVARIEQLVHSAVS